QHSRRDGRNRRRPDGKAKRIRRVRRSRHRRAADGTAGAGDSRCRLQRRRRLDGKHAADPRKTSDRTQEGEVTEMRSFELYEPTTVKQAVDTLTKLGPKAKVLAGGSDLVAGVMKDWVEGAGMPLPSALVDITTIPQLRGIKMEKTGATIGANTTLTEVVESKALNEQFSLVVQAAHSVASPLIRNFATLGGNLNQRPRCWFLRGKEFNCYKKGGDFCFSVGGDNRYHAVIGGELCYIVHPSDTATALLALNAKAKIAGVGGNRDVAFDSYFVGPREDVLRETVLKKDEFMTHVEIPNPASGTKFGWTKLKDRQVYDFAIVSVATAFTLEGSNWQDR